MTEAGKASRRLPPVTPDEIAAQEKRKYALAAKLNAGTYDDALVRAVLYILSSTGSIGSRTGLALNEARRSSMHLSLPDCKAIVKTQASIVQLYRDKAIESLPNLVPSDAKRRELLRAVRMIFLAAGTGTEEERDYLAQLAQILGLTEGVPSVKAQPLTAGAGPAPEEAVHSAE